MMYSALHPTILEWNIHSAKKKYLLVGAAVVADDDKKTVFFHTHRHSETPVWRRNETISWICGMEINWTREEKEEEQE